MTQNYDIAILGGGIIGNSIAAHLANNNLNIAVINSTNIGTPASIAAAGLLTPFQLNELENLQLQDFCLKSFEYFPKFTEEMQNDLNLDLGFKQSGTLYLIFSNYEISKKEGEIKAFKNLIPKLSFLNKHEVLKLEPHVTKDILGAYYYPNEGFVNNPKLLKAISKYCLDRKVTFLSTEALEINFSKSNIESILLANGEKLQANKFVICNGVWANKFFKKIFKINEDIIKAIKGEILQVEAIHELPLQKIIFCSEGYIVPRPQTNQFEKPSILVGSTSYEVNLDESNSIFQNTISGLSHLTSLFQKLFPEYKDLPVLNSWSGLRPKTKDGLPIIGQSKEITNLYLAVGHYRNGILMGPLTGKIISDLLMEKETEYNIEPFIFERFLAGTLRATSLPTH